MRISELMTTDVITVGPDAPLKEAARRMLEAGISGLPVTDVSGQLVGIITEADFVKTEAARDTRRRAGQFPSHMRTVGEVMTTPVLTVSPADNHSEAARLFAKHNIKRLPVVEDGQMIGLISRTDLLRSIVRPDKAIIDEISGHILRKILWIEPGKVTVGSMEGNVSLTGHLETKSDASLLVRLTEQLDGVVSVDNRLSWQLDDTKLDSASSVTTPFLSRGH